MRRPLVRVKNWPSHPTHQWVAVFRQGSKRRSRYFKSEAAAKSFANRKYVELINEGGKHAEITDAERRAVFSAREHGVDVAAAVAAFIARNSMLARSVPIESAIGEFLEIRANEGKSPLHLKDLRLRLAAFAHAFRPTLVAEITTKEIDAWLAGLAVASQTRVNYRRALHNFFAFATHRGYVALNPASAASKVKVPPKPIGILSADQTRALLAACSREIVAPVSIAAFCGLRRAEIGRLDWRQVDVARGFVEITAASAKSAQRRLVTIPENLKAWLSVSPRLDAGPVCPTPDRYRRLFTEALGKAGIESWPVNALRHTFASNHLAFHRNAQETALQLGHASSELLFRHYYEVVRREDAEEYWRIFPACGAS